MEKMILREFFKQGSAFEETTSDFRALVRHIENMPSAERHLTNATLINIHGALASLEAISAAME